MSFGVQNRQHRVDPSFKQMGAGAKKAGRGWEPAAAFKRLQTRLDAVHADMGLLNNGLSEDENRTLMRTSDIGKVVRLISKGLQTTVAP